MAARLSPAPEDVSVSGRSDGGVVVSIGAVAEARAAAGEVDTARGVAVQVDPRLTVAS